MKKTIAFLAAALIVSLYACGPKPVTQDQASAYIDKFKKLMGGLGYAHTFAKEWDKELPFEKPTSDAKIIVQMTEKYNKGLVDNHNQYLQQLVAGLQKGAIVAEDSIMKIDTLDGGGAMKTTALEMIEAYKKASMDEYPKLLSLRMAGDTVDANYEKLWKNIEEKLTPPSKKFSDARSEFGKKFNIHMLELDL